MTRSFGMNGLILAGLAAATMCGCAAGGARLPPWEVARIRDAANVRAASGDRADEKAAPIPGAVSGADGGTAGGANERAAEPILVSECRNGCIGVTLDGGEEHPAFRPYLQSVARRIGLNLVYPLETVHRDAGGEVVILFRIDRKGNVVSKEIHESSRRELLDRSAMKTLEVAGPFNPFPPAPYVQSMLIRARFRYSM